MDFLQAWSCTSPYGWVSGLHPMRYFLFGRAMTSCASAWQKPVAPDGGAPSLRGTGLTWSNRYILFTKCLLWVCHCATCLIMFNIHFKDWSHLRCLPFYKSPGGSESWMMDLSIRILVFWSWFKPFFSSSESLFIECQGINLPSIWNALFNSLHPHFSSRLFHEFSLTCLTLANTLFLSPHSLYSCVTQILYIVLYHFLIYFAHELTVSSLKDLVPLYPHPHQGFELGTYLMTKWLRGEKNHFWGEHNPLISWMVCNILRIYWWLEQKEK